MSAGQSFREQKVREKAEKEDEERIARGEAPSEKGPQWRPGVAYEGKQLATSHNFHKGVNVFAEPEKVTRGRFSLTLIPLSFFRQTCTRGYICVPLARFRISERTWI